MAPRVQRVAAYCVIHNALGQLLLTEIASHLPAAGQWTLPGGGIDFGEHPRDAARREVYEETGLHVDVGSLIDVDSFSTNRDGTDWHGLRIIYRATVLSGELGVVEVGGSTSAVAWFSPDDLADTALTTLAASIIGTEGASTAPTQLVNGIDHVQLAIPVGAEDIARRFWCGVLRFLEQEKPPGPASRGGAWFTNADGSAGVHVGTEVAFVPARKAHVALAVSDIDSCAQLLVTAGRAVRWSDDVPHTRRFHIEDPFGNRLEFVQTR